MAVHPTERGRDTDRTTNIAADLQGRQPGGKCRGPSAGSAPRRPREVPRIVAAAIIAVAVEKPSMPGPVMGLLLHETGTPFRRQHRLLNGILSGGQALSNGPGRPADDRKVFSMTLPLVIASLSLGLVPRIPCCSPVVGGVTP